MNNHSSRLRPFAPVVVAIALVGLGFVAAAAVSELWASRIDGEAEQIEKNALPSVEHLAAARDALWHLEIASQEYVDAPIERRADALTSIHAARGIIKEELSSELATDKYAGEAEVELDVARTLDALDQLLARIPDTLVGDEVPARVLVQHEARARIADVDTAMHRLMSLNAREGHAEAQNIARVRAISKNLTFSVTAASALFAVLAASAAVRALQRQREVEAAHEAMLSARSIELERFAFRVAHDLLSPLSALQFTLSSLRRSAEKRLPLGDTLARADACLMRSRALVSGVMEFARSGAAPGAARASMHEALDGVLEEARADAADVDFVVLGLDDDALVACSPGILTSILSNLVSNAVKYMEDRPEKRVTVRASLDRAFVHVEIEDTGPGLPLGLEARVFESYVRGPDNPRPGLGLGLATVKRFVESHGGHVGVDSSPGHGCVFWFDLPRAPGSESQPAK